MARRVLLTPRCKPIFGQDYLVVEAIESLGLTRLYKQSDGYYYVDSWDTPILVVTHNPNDPQDSSFISSLPDVVPVVAHLHLQWGHLEEQGKKFARAVFLKARRGVVPCDFMKQALEQMFPNVEWSVIRYGLNDARYLPTLAHDRQQFRTHHRLGNDDLVAIHVGRLENSKGLQVLRHFVLELARRKSRTRLVIQYLGNSSSQLLDQYAKIAQALKEDAPDNVRIVCDVDPRSERSVRYCDLLITPSLREVCPLVVLEAFLSGVPVISTNSTPFFRELDPDPIDSRFRQLLPLPDRFGNPWLTVSELYLNECESASLAEQLLAITDIAQVPGDVDRQLLADQARTAGFTLARMVADLKALYDSLNSRESLSH